MSIRTVVSTAITAVAFIASLQVASAVPLNPYTSQIAAGAGAVQGTILPNGAPQFELNPALNAGTFNHWYKFDVAAGGVDSVTLIQVHTPNPIPGESGVADLKISWLDAAFAAIAGGSLNITNATGQYILPATDGYEFVKSLNAGGPIYLYVEGTRIGTQTGGRYDFDIAGVECTNCGNDVPVPGAVFLFGTVLAGGVGGMQLMRRRRARAA